MTVSHSSPVGLVGAGLLGTRIAHHLLARSGELIVCDSDAMRVAKLVKEGARAAPTPAVLASRCELILLALPTPLAVQQVVTGESGILSTGRTDLLIADHSTNYPRVVQSLASECQAADSRFLDAPVTGGVVGAEKGELTVMIGGDAEDVERARPVLQLYTGRIVHVGPHGHGAAAKLVHNMLGEIQVSAIAEAFCFGARLGLNLDKLFEVLANGMATSRILTELYARGALRRNLQPSASVTTALKDQELLRRLADDAGITLTFSPVVLGRLRELARRGLGDMDVTSTLLLYEELFGVHIEISAAALDSM